MIYLEMVIRKDNVLGSELNLVVMYIYVKIFCCLLEI